MPTTTAMAPTLILDLAGVVYNWSIPDHPRITRRIMKQFITSSIWGDYETGTTSRAQCVTSLSAKFGVAANDITDVLDRAIDTVRVNGELIEELQRLRDNGGLHRVIAMSNVSAKDFDLLEDKLQLSRYFDEVYISGRVGMRKPDLRFFKHLLDESKLAPQDALFIDDTPEHIDTAKGLGIQSFIHTSNDETIRRLRIITEDPILRATGFMKKHAGSFVATTSDDRFCYMANFQQLLIYQMTGDKSLVNLDDSTRTWQYFSRKMPLKALPEDSPELVTFEKIKALTTNDDFPDDMDTTSLALSILPYEPSLRSSMMDEILRYRTADGRPTVYYDPFRPRICPGVATNILVPFAQDQRLEDVSETLEWLHAYYNNRAHLEGTRYYATGDVLLFYLARLFHMAPPTPKSPVLYHELASILKQCLKEQIGKSTDALSLGMRLVACLWAGVKNTRDRQTFLELQDTDGGWPAGSWYRFPTSGVIIGNRGFVTTLALYLLSARDPDTSDVKVSRRRGFLREGIRKLWRPCRD